MTRIEVFSDAAFAFAVTMLVISLSSIPKNYAELIFAIKDIPSFAASFVVMMVIWFTHRRWSQRFGLDDGISTLLTLSLVFIVLVYVYPLKLVMDLMFFAFSNDWFPTDFMVYDTSEVAGLIAFFSIGFGLIALIQCLLYKRVSFKSDDLCLNNLEKLFVQKEQFLWLILALWGMLSAIIAVVFMSSFGYLAGTIYGLLPLVIPIMTLKLRRKIKLVQISSEESNLEINGL